MEIEEVTAYEFTCTPWDRSFPIRQMKVIIYAHNREEAEQIKMQNDYKFFDQNMTVSVLEFGGGYRIKDESRPTKETNTPRE